MNILKENYDNTKALLEKRYHSSILTERAKLGLSTNTFSSKQSQEAQKPTILSIQRHYFPESILVRATTREKTFPKIIRNSFIPDQNHQSSRLATFSTAENKTEFFKTVLPNTEN